MAQTLEERVKELQEELRVANQKAATEDLLNLPQKEVESVALWAEHWYPVVGYKVIGRLLVQYAQEGFLKEEQEGA